MPLYAWRCTTNNHQIFWNFLVRLMARKLGKIYWFYVANKFFTVQKLSEYRNSPPEGFLGKGVLKICSKFTAEHPCRSTTSIKLLCNFINIVLQYECFPVNLLLIFRMPLPKNTSGWVLEFFPGGVSNHVPDTSNRLGHYQGL